MSKEYEGGREILRDTLDGDMLSDERKEGDLIVSEAPKGDPLWKKKKKIYEDTEIKRILNEAL